MPRKALTCLAKVTDSGANGRHSRFGRRGVISRRVAEGDQDGAGTNYDLNADYSSSTLDDSRFPATVTDFGSVALANPEPMDALRR